MQAIELQIAAQSVHGIPKDDSLADRIKYAMGYVRAHERDIFWMSGSVNDDAKLRTALAAVMLACGTEDRDIITRSLKPLQMLSAASQGIPVDFFSSLDEIMTDDPIPLMKLWHETADA